MTRTRKSVGRVSFVGAGPGDPELLTRRAYEAIRAADHIVYDRALPAALLDWVRAQRARRGRSPASPPSSLPSSAAERTEFSPAEGAPGDVAKVLMSAARSGLHAVHLVVGDPFEHDWVVKEVQAVSRTTCPSRWCPG